MVIVSKKTATTLKGELKKGYRCVVAKNGREMYMTELKDGATKTKKKAEPKKKMEKKEKMEKMETEEKPKRTRKKKTLPTAESE